MFIKIKLYKYLRNNIDLIVSIIYRKVIQDVTNMGFVAKIFDIFLQRIVIIFKWLYFGIFVTILIYIVSIGNYIFKVFEIIFSYIQKLGKIIIDLIITITGPLTIEIMNNIWLLIVLLCLILILIISIKIIKYYIKKRLEVKLEKRLFIDELMKKLVEQDELINNQLSEIEKLKNNNKINILDIVKNKEEEKEDIHEINLYGVIYKIDISKIKK